MDNFNKTEKSLETRRSVESPRKNANSGLFRFKSESNLSQQVWVPEHRTKEAETMWEQSIWNFCSVNNEKKTDEAEATSNSLNQERVRARSERKHETENLSSTEENDVVKPSASFPINDVKDYDIAEKTLHHVQVDRVIRQSKTKNVEA